jgi:hypothetical protein
MKNLQASADSGAIRPNRRLYSLPMRGGVVAALGAVLLLFALESPAGAGPLWTGIIDPTVYANQNRAAQGFQRTAATGAKFVRLQLIWHSVAPGGAQKPAGFNAADPRAPEYNQGAWARMDNQVIRARQAGLEPIIYIQMAPKWAEGAGSGEPGTVRPDPVEFGLFARAAAERYSGTFVPVVDPYSEQYGEALPRVRYWMAWNEPNRDYFFMPQYDANRQLVSPGHYRAMVNRFADHVHAVHPSNMVIAGGLAPLGKPGKPAPLAFMRSFLSSPAKFDIWAHHPYTSGGPTHHALKRDDVSLGDLPEMRGVLRSAIRSGRVVSATGSAGFWVTEFSWDSNPPDRRALPAGLHARWVSEALYRMWSNGIPVVIWYRIQDDPLSVSAYQSGFFTASGQRKRSFQAFRFPSVAFTKRTGIFIWGRTPMSQAGRVVVEIKTGRRWRQLARLNANRYGIFKKTLRTRIRRGHVRARLGSERSLPFSLTPVGDRYVNPFGCGGGIPC